MTEPRVDVLVLGIGNVLMGDEGVGVSVVRELGPVPPGVCCLDGGTGSFQLLEPLGRARRVVLWKHLERVFIENRNALIGDGARDRHCFGSIVIKSERILD